MKKKFTGYIFNLSKAFWWVFKALIGRAVPKYVMSIADNVYYSPTQAIINKAFEMLTAEKEKAGFTREGYESESRDCDNSAIWDYSKLLNEILPFLLRGTPEAKGKGLNCGMYTFMRDKGKGRHRVAYVQNPEGERTYSDSYLINGTIKRFLSPTEKAAGYDLK